MIVFAVYARRLILISKMQEGGKPDGVCKCISESQGATLRGACQ